MKFSYTATTKSGKEVKGNAEAIDKSAMVASLYKQGLKPVTVKAEGGAEKSGRIGRVKSRELVVFTRQLSTMVSAGVPLVRSLSTLQAQAESENFRKVLVSISKDVESGLPLHQAFARYPKVFSDVYVNMVKAGESGGILDEILKRLAAQVEQDASMKKKVKTAMAYPVVIMGITVIAFFGIMIFVLPKIGEILKDLGGENAELPVYTTFLLNMSRLMQENALLMLVVGVVGVFLFKRYISTPSGKYNWHSLLLKIPVVKMIILKIAIARFSRTFASLMGAGVGVLDALEVTGGAIGNKVIEKELLEAAKEIKAGKQLSEPLSQSPHFPAIVSQMLAIGEETGQIDTILIKVADFYEEEAAAVIDSLSSIIEPLMIVVLGGIVGVIAASVMGPIASLSQNIGTE